MWTEITNQGEIDELMTTHKRFEGCQVQEAHFLVATDAEAVENQTMDDALTIVLMFGGQFNGDVLELKFENVVQFVSEPPAGYERGILSGITLKLENELFYYAEQPDWQIGDDTGPSIASKKLFWRIRPEIGEEQEQGEQATLGQPGSASG